MHQYAILWPRHDQFLRASYPQWNVFLDVLKQNGYQLRVISSNEPKLVITEYIIRY